MKKQREVTDKESLNKIKAFFDNNKHINQYQLCKKLEISLRTIYLICKTQDQRVSQSSVDILLEFINSFEII